MQRTILRTVALSLGLVLSACGAEEVAAEAHLGHDDAEHGADTADDQAEEGTATGEDTATEDASGPRVFGQQPSDGALTELSTILGDPASYNGQVVRTEGEITQVCQRMGCWMEMRPVAGGDAVRVPMAGHNFFLPRDVSGRIAMVEGRLAMETLSAETIAHLESEGATAAASASLSIEATGVVVR